MDEIKKAKGKLVWLVNVVLEGENLMFQFPTIEAQKEFIEKIKNRVDSYVYALDPVQLISEEKSKKQK